mmetsp:Transcript_61617/g.175014  ORF Transcript_61617/g.175014 Transcript_61617/m.175014 type:complete len:127 (-) Transcript_61617:325-705(-)
MPGSPACTLAIMLPMFAGGYTGTCGSDGFPAEAALGSLAAGAGADALGGGGPGAGPLGGGGAGDSGGGGFSSLLDAGSGGGGGDGSTGSGGLPGVVGGAGGGTLLAAAASELTMLGVPISPNTVNS